MIQIFLQVLNFDGQLFLVGSRFFFHQLTGKSVGLGPFESE